MSSKTTASAELATSSAQIFSVLFDFGKYPDWAGFESAEILEVDQAYESFLVRFKLNLNGISDLITISIIKSDLTTMLWSLRDSSILTKLEAKFDIFDVSSDSCKVVYELDLKFKNPMMNLMKKTVESQMVEKLLSRLAKQAGAK